MAYKFLISHNFVDSTDTEGTTTAPTTAAPPPATDTPTDGIFIFLLIRALAVSE